MTQTVIQYKTYIKKIYSRYQTETDREI